MLAVIVASVEHLEERLVPLQRDEVAAVYVDLDKKTLSLVIGEGEALSDKQIEDLAEKAGYRIAAIRRDSEALGG